MNHEKEKADLFRRISAFVIDHFIIVYITLIPFFIKFNEIVNQPVIMFDLFYKFMILAFLLYILKDSVRGKSLGKWLVGIKVSEDTNFNKIPSIYRLILRNILIIIWPVEFIVLLVSKDKRRIGDKLAKTDVVKDEKKSNRTLRIIIIILIIITFISSTFIFVIHTFKTSEGYQIAINYIRQSKDIKEITGEVIDFGNIPLGSINVTNGYGEAYFDIKVRGKEETINVHIELIKKPGEEWKVVDLQY